MAVSLAGQRPERVAWTLGALIAVELARIAAALLSGQVKSPEPVLEASAPRPKPGVNVQALISAHLFGVAVADPSTKDPNNAPLSSANLALAGTIATENPKKGIAIISDGSPSKVFVVGDNVTERPFTRSTLTMSFWTEEAIWRLYCCPACSPVARGPHRSVPPPMFAPRSQAKTSAACYTRSCARSPPTTVPPGSSAAFGPILAATGPCYGTRLEARDLVTAINGQPLDDAQKSERVMNTAQTAASVTVTIERGGNRQDVSFNVADIATKAPHDLETEKLGGAGATAPSARRRSDGCACRGPCTRVQHQRNP